MISLRVIPDTTPGATSTDKVLFPYMALICSTCNHNISIQHIMDVPCECHVILTALAPQLVSFLQTHRPFCITSYYYYKTENKSGKREASMEASCGGLDPWSDELIGKRQSWTVALVGCCYAGWTALLHVNHGRCWQHFGTVWPPWVLFWLPFEITTTSDLSQVDISWTLYNIKQILNKNNNMDGTWTPQGWCLDNIIMILYIDILLL